MEYLKELLDTFKELSALKVRTEEVAARIEKVHDTLQMLLQRVTLLESRVDEMRTSIKAEVMGEVSAQVAETKLLLELAQAGRLLFTPPAGISFRETKTGQ